MWERELWLLAVIVLAACSNGSNDGQEQAASPPPAQDTALRDAAQAPLERAEGVQQTLDERAARLDAETRAALDQDADPNEDPNAKKDKDKGDEE